MTWFCVSKIFGPVGPEKTVICDRSAFAERSCKKSFCGTRYGIMTWFPVREIFEPVGPEKTVICDRSALAERSCRGGHWPSEKLRFAEITGYVHAGRFRMTNGHPYGEDMALHSRGRCPHRPAPGRLRHGEMDLCRFGSAAPAVRPTPLPFLIWLPFVCTQKRVPSRGTLFCIIQFPSPQSPGLQWLP